MSSICEFMPLSLPPIMLGCYICTHQAYRLGSIGSTAMVLPRRIQECIAQRAVAYRLMCLRVFTHADDANDGLKAEDAKMEDAE